PYFWLGVLAQLVIVGLTRKKLAASYQHVVEAQEGFARYERIFGVAEAGAFKHPHLVALQRGLQPEGSTPLSRIFSSFSRRLAFAELRQSNQLHPAINLLTLWDLPTLFALERWRLSHGPNVRAWFEAL